MKKVYLFYMFFAALLFGGCKHDTVLMAFTARWIELLKMIGLSE